MGVANSILNTDDLNSKSAKKERIVKSFPLLVPIRQKISAPGNGTSASSLTVGSSKLGIPEKN